MKILIKLIIFGLILTSCVNEQDEIEFKEVRNIYKSVSPKISAFENLSKPDRELAIFDLLKNERNQRFPLIEIDSLYSDYVYATFIYLDTT